MNRLRMGIGALLAIALGASAAPVGTAITYQGQLQVSGTPADGSFDFEFALFDVAIGGSAIAVVPGNNVPVANGGFTVELDYTDVPFVAAQEYFLEVRVRGGTEVGGFQQLLPRQKITPAPYAVNARSVQSGGVGPGAIAPGAVGGGQLANLAVTDAKIADGTITQGKLAFTAGDVTGVTAGTGLTGGGASGDVDVAVDMGVVQARVTGTCAAGEYFRGIAADGSLACESIQTYLGIPLFTTVDDPASNVGYFMSIAIGTGGLPVISYYDITAQALKVARCATSACTGVATITTVDDPGNVGEDTSIEVGLDGFPVISYRGAGQLKVAKCVDEACAGAATITPVDTTGAYTSIAIDADGLPVISYRDSNATALKVAKCGDAACTSVTSTTTVDNSFDVGEYTSIAIGSDGLPIVSYFDRTFSRLRVAKCVDAACASPATITALDPPVQGLGNFVGDYTSIAIGADGLAVISYHDLTTSALKVAKCSNLDCTAALITTVDDPSSGNAVGTYTSIAVGSAGLPVISHWDNTAFALKVAACANPECTGVSANKTVDDTTTGGSYTAIAIGTDGLPVIAYRGDSISLKVAKCGTPGCQ